MKILVSCRLLRTGVMFAVITVVTYVFLSLCANISTVKRSHPTGPSEQSQQLDPSLKQSSLPLSSSIPQNDYSSENELVHLKRNDPEFSFRKNSLFQPSKCPTSIQKKLLNISWTSEKYHPEIKQLLTSSNISVQEYQRLSKYWMPFGFKYHVDFTYEELLKVLRLFPREESIFDFSQSETRPQCISCAVVGNGGILNGSKMGKEIDGHDMVFRVNNCIRRGYEVDVGNRTTHLVLMDRSLGQTNIKDVPRDKGIKYILLPCRKNDFEYIVNEVAGTSRRRKLRADANDVRILHPDFIRYVHKIWENTKAFRPTTGGMMFFTALHAGCDSISVYGMGFTGHFTEHYYDRAFIRYKSFKASHDFGKEIEILQSLNRDGVILWYKRDVPEFQ
ncbi:alpha-N-acetylgalactosaminide alpha-2,6-sialyltransferase 1-like [Asterias rubens]|uniref:alpha-N-acetylgalactosaminide alpha-2,6-sialyltransferase 1-like n=1 Tax=Asterias rubens TaxID=7604 RepID=UPI001455C8D6|nr:alpha-N-acetylgalactosaminide alpha-2,6-sialyltransferase 1-like [Asterias rubens]XP_033647866.1 alpha-N-acetylgalactosaminide alpha-2,6-sialyltransferase 1-like [Asterias rubens]